MKSSSLFRVQSFITCIALATLLVGNSVATADLITGNQTISSDTTPTDGFYQVGTDDTVGNLNVTGGTLTLTGGTPSKLDFRDQQPSLLLINGTVTVSNATVEAQNGVYVNAKQGNVGSIVLNSGSEMISSSTNTKAYPVFGADTDHFGSLTINDGGKFTSHKSFYVSGHGIGSVTLNDGGTLDIVGNGMQIARDYEIDNKGKGKSEGTFTMNGGTLKVGSYFIMGRNQKDDPDHVNKGVFTMKGGTTTVETFFSIANNANTTIDDPKWINDTVNIGGGASEAKLTVAGNFTISNGEGYEDIMNSKATGTFNVYNNANIKIGVDTATGVTAQDKSFIIGQHGTLNVYGGDMSVHGKKGVTNVGTINVDGGNLTFADSVVTVKNWNTVNVKGGKLTTASFEVGDATHAATLNVTGGELVATSAKSISLQHRPASVSFDVVNGTVTVNDGTIIAEGDDYAGIRIGAYDANAGTSATMIVNGGEVKSTGYSWVGLEHGSTGKLIINNNGKFNNEKKSLYIGYNGVGYLELNDNGELYVEGNFQIARNYDYYDLENKRDGGKCNNPGSEGYVKMTGGTITATGTLLLSRYGTNSTVANPEATISVFDMSGGTVDIQGSVSMAADANGTVQSTMRLSGGTFEVGSNFGLGNGEGQNSLIDSGNGGNGLLVISDYAELTVAGFTGVGKNSKLIMTGGTFTTNNLTNAGTIKIADGLLTINGSYSNSDNGNITVGLDRGLGILKNNTEEKTLITATNGNLESVEASNLFTVTKTANEVKAKLNTDLDKGELNIDSEVNLSADPAEAGYVTLSGFDGNTNPLAIDMNLSGITGEDLMNQLTDWLSGTEMLFDESTITGNTEKSTVSILTPENLADNLVFAWDFSDFNTIHDAHVYMNSLSISGVPEPATWALMILGMLGIVAVRRVKK